jgi:hypothetical protein
MGRDADDGAGATSPSHSRVTFKIISADDVDDSTEGQNLQQLQSPKKKPIARQSRQGGTDISGAQGIGYFLINKTSLHTPNTR